MPLLDPLVGEPLALDLVNSHPRTPDGPIDFLATVEGLRRWVECERDRFPDLAEEAIVGPDLSAVRTVRAHAANAIEYARRDQQPPERDLRELNEILRAAPVARELVRSDGTLHIIARRNGAPEMRLAAQLAEAVADLLAHPSVTKIRRCEAPICILLFLPSHPRRRWCSPRICGNRTRVARYYHRHRLQQPG